MTQTTTAPKMKLNKKNAAPAAEAAETTAPAAEVAAPVKAKGLKKNAAAPAVAEKAVVKTETTQTETVGTSETQSIAPDDMILTIAKEVENLKEPKAFELVSSLMESSDRDQFRLGGVFNRINKEGWYQNKGFETFKDFVESTYGIKYRRAMYWVDIYNSLVASQIPWDSVKHLGWTKLVELIKHLTVENLDEWLTAVDGLTTDQIRALVAQKTKGVVGGVAASGSATVTEITTMTFKVHKDQKATVREALDKCKHETGTEFDNVALEHICLDYLGGESALANTATLQSVMEGKSAEEILTTFSEMFPDWSLEVTPPKA